MLMLEVNIDLPVKGYPVYIDTGFDNFTGCMDKAGLGGKAVIITDQNVDGIYSEAFASQLKPYCQEVFKYVLEAGEKSKTLDTVRDIYAFLMDCRLERSSVLIALGGGVVGDITGFAAATFLRGINFVQVPTTLLAQADSSIGGKVGVDFQGSKNIIGSFYQPSFVYINVSTVSTLPEREIRNGLAETIKHGLISDGDFFDYIEENIEKVFSADPGVLQCVAKTNCRIKGQVVAKDERESGLRAILNFGHTIGHAVESVSDFRLMHGECVSLGMVGAYKIALRLGMVTQNELCRVSGVLEKSGLPVKASGVDPEAVYRQMYYDKKIKDGRLKFILPKGIGSVAQCTVEDEGIIKNVLHELLAGG